MARGVTGVAECSFGPSVAALVGAMELGVRLFLGCITYCMYLPTLPTLLCLHNVSNGPHCLARLAMAGPEIGGVVVSYFA